MSEHDHIIEGSGSDDGLVRNLTKDQLETILAEEDTRKQFELFASYLAASRGSQLLGEAAVGGVGEGGEGGGLRARAQPSSITLEYCFMNLMFCREQNFTPEQTLAFLVIARSVFEAGVVRSELDLKAAFSAFTAKVLALAVVDEDAKEFVSSKESTAATVMGRLRGRGTGDTINTGNIKAPSERAAVQGEAQKETITNNSRVAPMLSVGDVGAITQFVARGLYRNFALYRMCFQQEAKFSRESRILQVQTPLAPQPLKDAELF